jgi:hypothetical protein
MSSPPGSVGPGPKAPLGRRGRTGRLVAVVAGALLLLLGTCWGQDDDFPFGPFRMYATSSKANGVVVVSALRAEWSDGTHSPVQPEEFGLRRAELEGQLDRFRHDPALLASLGPKLHRPNMELRALVLESRGRRLVDGKVQRTEVVDDARWEAP